MSARFMVEGIPVARIDVGERRRRGEGAAEDIRQSFERVGQIHPITVRTTGDRYELVSGYCRLSAAKALGWKTIRARVGRFSDDELRQIELDENQCRKNLSAWEASEERGKQIEAAEREAEEAVSAQVAQKPGRPKGGDSDAARRTGLSRDEIRRTKSHLSAGQRYPVLQRGGFTRQEAIDLGEKLDALPQRDRGTVEEIISEPGIPEPKVRKMIENASALPAPERKEALDLYRSGDDEKQSLAKSRLAKTPPKPWHRLTWLREAIQRIERTLDDGKHIAQGDLRSCLSSLKSVLKESEQAYREFRNEEMNR